MSDDIDYKRFGALSVVLVDGDPSSAQSSRELLSSLGIYQIQIVTNYDEFIEKVSEKPVDLVVFDTNNKTVEDLGFIEKLRSEPNDIALTPLLALSTDTTKQDVHNIIDAGATELVAYPANIKSMFGRLQNMVDSPRSFISTPDFKGPDRRRKQQPGVEDESRTSRSPQMVTREEYLKGDIDGPVMIMPDFSLKVKANHITPGTIMRPAVEDEFIFWSLSDLAAIEASYLAISDGAKLPPNLERICSSCLSIEARSEAYGYTLGGQVTEKLRDFCQNHFSEDNKDHLVVLEKHIQTLSLIYNGRLGGDGGDQGKALDHDLGLLAKKYIN